MYRLKKLQNLLCSWNHLCSMWFTINILANDNLLKGRLLVFRMKISQWFLFHKSELYRRQNWAEWTKNHFRILHENPQLMDLIGTFEKVQTYETSENLKTKENVHFCSRVFPNWGVLLSSIYVLPNSFGAQYQDLWWGHLSSVPYRTAQFVTFADTTLLASKEKQQKKCFLCHLASILCNWHNMLVRPIPENVSNFYSFLGCPFLLKIIVRICRICSKSME